MVDDSVSKKSLDEKQTVREGVDKGFSVFGVSAVVMVEGINISHVFLEWPWSFKSTFLPVQAAVDFHSFLLWKCINAWNLHACSEE